MFYLQKRIPQAQDGLRGYRWKTIYYCPERWPLEVFLSKLGRKNYRITSNRPEETT